MKRFTVLVISLLCLTCMGAMAQKKQTHDQFANFKRYEQANKELPAPAKKEKRIKPPPMSSKNMGYPHIKSLKLVMPAVSFSKKVVIYVFI